MTYIWRCDIQEKITCGKGGGGTNTVVQNSQPPAWIQAAYQQLLGQGNQVAAAPFQQPQQPVAGFTQDQTTAMNTVAGANGMTQPYTNAATADVTQGSQEIYPQLQQYNQTNLSNYENPYSQDVINSTMALANQQDAQQQSGLAGNAIQAGASPFGGDRAGVAAAALAGQQNLANNQTIAGLENQNFTQAQAELNNQQQLQANTQASDAWRQLSGGQELGALGTQAQSNTLNQASAQLQSGALQQQLAQEQLNAPYNEELAALAYPFQTTQFLGGLTEAIGSGSGGTGTTTSPGASTASQLGGLGLTGFALDQMLPAGYGISQALTGASMFGLKSGGVAGHYDVGGGVELPPLPDALVSIVPQSSNQKIGNGPPQAPKPTQQQSSSPIANLSQGVQLGKLFNSISSSSGSPTSGGISPAASSVFNSNAGGSFGGDAALASQGANDSNFLSPGSVGSAGIDFGNFKYGGHQHRAIGGEILPILGDVAGAFFGDPMAGSQVQMGMDLLDKLHSGGIAGHYDVGGMITTPAQAAIAGANPIQQQQSSSYNNMSLNQLMQLATMQPNNPMIQRALQMKKMGVNSSGSSTGMARGGVRHFDDGGSADSPEEQVLQDIANEPTGVGNGNPVAELDNNPISNGINAVNASDLLPPDARGIAPPAAIINDSSQPLPSPEGELDAKPSVDHSGDTVKLHSEGKTIDTGLPSFKDSGPASSAWEPLLAAGLGMMSGTSPHALVNVGRGGLEGLQALGEQRAAALKENQAQNKAQNQAAGLDLRKQQMQQEQGQFNTKQTTLSAEDQAQLDLKKQELQQEANKIAQEQWQIIPDQMGGFIKYNKKTGETQTVAGANGSSAPPIDPKTGQPLTGDAYLATLSPENAAQIKALDEGRLNFPAGFALKSPYWQQKLSQLYQYNPDASQQTAAAVKAFNQGPQGNQTRSLNVAVNHLDTLNQMTDALNNGDIKALNAAGNLWQAQTGSPAPTNFNTVKQIVGDEVTKAVLGAGGTGADREKAQSVIDASNSPEQLKGAIQTYKSLMTGQLGGLKQQYEVSTGRKDYDKYLTAAAKEALLPQQQNNGSSTIPTISSPSDPSFQALPKGASFMTPDGRTLVKN